MRLPLLLVLCSSLSLAAERPRLAVLLVIDQLSAATFEQRMPLATAGIKRMVNDGLWVKQLRYQTAPTVTSVGHATLVTGAWPETHGIVSNEWLDEALGKKTFSTEDPRYQIVGREPLPRDCTSPWLLKVATLADTLKAYRKDSKTIAISGKDRSAILPAGWAADGVVWLDHREGVFVTSTFYSQTLPAWAEGANALITRTVSAGTQATFAAAGKSPLPAARPPPTDGGHELLNERLELQPVYEHAQVDAALAAVKALQLGKDDAPDFLSVSFSSHDYLAHAFGPDAPELTDDFRRLDIQIGRLLDGLDKEVGKGKYVVALSADHGGGQNPELLKARRLDAGRVDGWVTVRNALEAEADAALGPGDWFAGYWTPGLFANPAARVKLNAVAARIVAAGRKIDGVYDIFPLTELSRPGTYGPLGELYRNGAFPGRSPDFIVVPKPNWTYGTRDFAAHGTPWLYDRAVPLVLFGGGVKKGELDQADAVDVAPTLAWLVGSPAPPAAIGRSLISR